MPEFFGSAKALPFRKLPFHHSLIAIRYSPFAVYYSLLATRYSPSFWLGRSLALPLRSVPRPASHAPFRFCPMSLVPCPLSP